jgi:hypothetical protein
VRISGITHQIFIEAKHISNRRFREEWNALYDQYTFSVSHTFFEIIESTGNLCCPEGENTEQKHHSDYAIRKLLNFLNFTTAFNDGVYRRLFGGSWTAFSPVNCYSFLARGRSAFDLHSQLCQLHWMCTSGRTRSYRKQDTKMCCIMECLWSRSHISKAFVSMTLPKWE